MHVLRAEKGYPIIGQDTDGTVTPHDLGMALGGVEEEARLRRQALLRPPGEPSPLRKQLVGLLPVDRRTAAARGLADRRVRRRRAAAAAAGADARARHLQLPQRRARAAVRARAGQGAAGRGSATPCTSLSRAPSSRWRSPVRCSSTRKERAAMAELPRTHPLRSRPPAGRPCPAPSASPSSRSSRWPTCGSTPGGPEVTAALGVALPTRAEHLGARTSAAVPSGSGPTSGC